MNATPPTPPRKALVIDDEEAIRDACSRVLTREGLEVHTAHNGEVGLELAQELLPDLVLLDLKMPKLAGMPVLDELNQICPEAVKVVVTAYASVTTAMEAVRHGAYDFLAKPFTPDELRLAVHRGLEHLRLRQENQALARARDLARQACLDDAQQGIEAPLAAVRRDLAALADQAGLDIPSRGLLDSCAQRLDQVLALLASLPERN